MDILISQFLFSLNTFAVAANESEDSSRLLLTVLHPVPLFMCAALQRRLNALTKWGKTMKRSFLKFLSSYALGMGIRTKHQ